MVFDVRCLPNPFYDEAPGPSPAWTPPAELRHGEGGDKKGFVSRFTDLIDYLLPLYSKEGKSPAGRSPWAAREGITVLALAQYMCDHLTEKGVKASVTHRDMQKF